MSKVFEIDNSHADTLLSSLIYVNESNIVYARSQFEALCGFLSKSSAGVEVLIHFFAKIAAPLQLTEVRTQFLDASLPVLMKAIFKSITFIEKEPIFQLFCEKFVAVCFPDSALLSPLYGKQLVLDILDCCCSFDSPPHINYFILLKLYIERLESSLETVLTQYISHKRLSNLDDSLVFLQVNRSRLSS